MKVTIDRIEGEYAVIELPNRDTIDIPLSYLPKNAKEGDIFILTFLKPEKKNILKH
jgi:hypothetical protein